MSINIFSTKAIDYAAQRLYSDSGMNGLPGDLNQHFWVMTMPLESRKALVAAVVKHLNEGSKGT